MATRRRTRRRQYRPKRQHHGPIWMMQRMLMGLAVKFIRDSMKQ